MTMRIEQSKRKCGGFTLIEVIGATVILSIVVMGTMQYSVQSHRIILRQGNERAALWRARQRMELIRAVPTTAAFWSSLPLNGSYYLSGYNSDTGMFTATSSKPTEEIDVNTGRGTIVSTVKRVLTAKVGSAVQGQRIDMNVTVRYGDGPRDEVSLTGTRTVYQ